MFNHLFDTYKKIKIQPVLFHTDHGNLCQFDVARFDELDPVISGNKYFKLKYNIESAINTKKTGIITMGGAFSNHLVATANICNRYGLKSIGLTRGEIAGTLNYTLASCQSQNMKLIPVPRNQFTENSETIQKIIADYSDFHFIPMGGANEDGLKGASEMIDMIPDFEKYDVILCAMGSGTMLNGFQKRILPHQHLVGIPVMKIQETEKTGYIAAHSNNQTRIYTEFAGKGYGKPDPDIISLMNEMYRRYHLPLDFVYTGKLMHALLQLLEKKEINKNKKILFIHSGGLQGNHSLPTSALIFQELSL